jgi:hypothetical protein
MNKILFPPTYGAVNTCLVTSNWRKCYENQAIFSLFIFILVGMSWHSPLRTIITWLWIWYSCQKASRLKCILCLHDWGMKIFISLRTFIYQFKVNLIYIFLNWISCLVSVKTCFYDCLNWNKFWLIETGVKKVMVVS